MLPDYQLLRHIWTVITGKNEMELTLITKCCELNEHGAYRGYMCWQIHYNHNCHYKMGTRLQWTIFIITNMEFWVIDCCGRSKVGDNRTAIRVMTSITLSLNKILLYVSDISKHAGGVHGWSECLGKFSLQPLKVTYFYSSFKFRDFNLKGPE